MTPDQWRVAEQQKFQERKDMRERLSARNDFVNDLWAAGVDQPERLAKAAEDFCTLYPEIAADEARRSEAFRMEARLAQAGDKRDPLTRFQEIGERMKRGENEADLEYLIENGGFRK